MSHPRTQPSPGDLVDLARQSAADAEASDAALRHRDRAIGRELAHLEHRPLPQLLAWLERVRTRPATTTDTIAPGRADRVDTLHRVGLLVLTVAGLLAGWGAAAVVFWYDGTHPVNVIHVLAVFVLLPVVLLLGFAVGLLPPRATRWLPGFGALHDTLGLLSPGRLQHLFARWLPQAHRDTLATLLARSQTHARLHGRVDRWVVAHSSQAFALAFHVGALASAVYLIVFSDLAFAWSTTLQTDPAAMQRWTDLVSAPWAWAWPDARPSGELIARTRYFRLGEGTFPAAAAPTGLGGWWPFLVMCIAVYGVVPRLATLLLTRGRLRAALRRAVLRFPGIDDLRVRLNSELVETRADQPEAGADARAGTDPVPAAARLDGRPALVLAWAGAAGGEAAGAPWLRAALGADVNAWHEVGGNRPLAADQAAIAQAAATDDAPLVVARAWEPPMAELLDFLRDLRGAVGDGRTVNVLPVGADAAGAPAVAEPRHRDLWRRALARAGDPWLRVLDPGAVDDGPAARPPSGAPDPRGGDTP